jgi:hypothetical protein
MADFSLIGAEEPAATDLPPTGPADWVPGTAVLVRRAVLDEFPIDGRMSAYYEDNEWCYRVERARPGGFRRSREARAVHHFTYKHSRGSDFTTRSRAVELLQAQARFYERHRLLLGSQLFDLVPELRDPDGTPDVAGARLLMELLLAKGTDWVFAAWMNGDLDPLLRSARVELKLAEQAEVLEFLYDRHATLQRVENGGWWRLRRRLLPALQIYSRLRQRS